MDTVRRLLWGIVVLLALNLLSLWIGEYRRSLEQALLQIHLEAQEGLCKQELYRLRSEDLYRVNNRLKDLEHMHSRGEPHATPSRP